MVASIYIKHNMPSAILKYHSVWYKKFLIVVTPYPVPGSHWSKKHWTGQGPTGAKNIGQANIILKTQFQRTRNMNWTCYSHVIYKHQN